MAIHQKRHGRCRVRIQRQGMKAESFTADTKGECQFWAKRREAELDRLALMSTLPALPAPLPVVVSARPWTVRELVENYRRVVLPQQKAGKANGHHLDAMLRTADFADRSCYDIKRRDAVRWFDLRLAQVSPAAAVPRRSRERTHPCSRLRTLEVRSRECGGGSSTESTGGPPRIAERPRVRRRDARGVPVGPRG
jgi:hypothetical protein